MHKRVKLAVLALAMASVLAGWATGASANRLSVNRREIRIVWSALTFTSNAGRRVTCGVTLEGRMEEATFTKVLNLRIGTITSGSSSCSETIRFLFEQRWDLLYETFFGTLPNITNLYFKINGIAFSWIGGYTCKYRSEARSPTSFNATRNTETWQLTRIDAPGAAGRMPPIEGSSIFCTNVNDEAYLNGSGVITRAGEGEGIFLSLI